MKEYLAIVFNAEDDIARSTTVKLADPEDHATAAKRVYIALGISEPIGAAYDRMWIVDCEQRQVIVDTHI